jgi:bacteriocin biosynthesis cyclodehydratase domain-containing protein
MGRPQAIGIGPFGHSFICDLAKSHDAVESIVLSEETIASLTLSDHASSYILATWRPMPLLCQRVSDMSRDRHKPFIPVVIGSDRMTIGPVVIPGGQGCWQCYVKRTLQHTHAAAERSTLLQYYASHPEEGPGGHLRPFATIAAGRCGAILDELDNEVAQPGQLWHLDLMTRRVTAGVLLGVHDCPYCGLHRPDHDRSMRDMQVHLSYLWDGKVTRPGDPT